MTASKAAEDRAALRRWSTAEKRRIVELAFGAGIPTLAVALDRGNAVLPTMRPKVSDTLVPVAGVAPIKPDMWRVINYFG